MTEKNGPIAIYIFPTKEKKTLFLNPYFASNESTDFKRSEADVVSTPNKRGNKAPNPFHSAYLEWNMLAKLSIGCPKYETKDQKRPSSDSPKREKDIAPIRAIAKVPNI